MATFLGGFIKWVKSFSQKSVFFMGGGRFDHHSIVIIIIFLGLLDNKKSEWRSHSRTGCGGRHACEKKSVGKRGNKFPPIMLLLLLPADAAADGGRGLGSRFRGNMKPAFPVLALIFYAVPVFCSPITGFFFPVREGRLSPNI